MNAARFILLAIMVPAVALAQKKNAEYYFTQGEAAFDDNKPVMALAHFNECLRLDPYYWDAYSLRAATRESLGDVKGALTDYNIYINSRPNDPDAILARGVLRYQLGQYLPAREDFLKLLTTRATTTSKIIFRQTSEGTDKMFTLQQNSHAEFFNYLGIISIKLKEYSKATVYLDSAVKLSPKDAQSFINRGILREHLMDTTGALADYQEALRIEPASGIARHNIAVIQRSRGEQEGSLKLFNDAIQQTPSLPAPYSSRAFYYFQQKDWKAALLDYDKVISLAKTDEESWLYRGLVKEKLKDYDGAFVDFTEAISLKNDFASAWMARGTLLTRLNRLPEAIEDYSIAILWYPEYGLAWYNRGFAKLKLKKNKESCEDFTKAANFGAKVPDDVKQLACGNK